MAKDEESYFSDLPGKPEFLNKEKTIVVFRAKIEAINVIQCLSKCIKAKLWTKCARIIIASGFHTFENGKLGGTFSCFPGLIATHLMNLKEDCVSEIKEMSYTFESLNMRTYPISRETNELDGLSWDDLKSKMVHVLDSKDQYIFIFATCFSKESDVNSYIHASGLYPALLMSSERGCITDGKDFQLDKQQQKALRKFCGVKVFSLLCQYSFAICMYHIS